jgi:hypothetical protein
LKMAVQIFQVGLQCWIWMHFLGFRLCILFIHSNVNVSFVIRSTIYIRPS